MRYVTSPQIRDEAQTLDVSLRISSPHVCSIQPLGTYGLSGSGPCLYQTLFDLGDSSCEPFLIKSVLFFSGVTLQGAAVRTFQERSLLNQQCMNRVQTQTGGLQVRTARKYMLVCRTGLLWRTYEYIHGCWCNCPVWNIKELLLWDFNVNHISNRLSPAHRSSEHLIYPRSCLSSNAHRSKPVVIRQWKQSPVGIFRYLPLSILCWCCFKHISCYQHNCWPACF